MAPGVRALEPLDVESTVEQVRVLGAHEQLTSFTGREPVGPLPGESDALGDELANVSRYPIEAYDDFRADAARSLGVPSGCIVPGHGTQGLIGTVATTLLQPGDAVVQPAVTFYLYGMVSVARGASGAPSADGRTRHRSRGVVAQVTRRGRQARLGLRSEQSNGNGARAARVGGIPRRAARAVCGRRRRGLCGLPTGRPAARARAGRRGREALVVLRSFSKFFGLAGLRLGCAIADEALAGYLRVVDEPFNVNCVALAAGRASLRAC